MYNGVGLVSARGSSTSGYVQRNLASTKADRPQHRNYKEGGAKRDSIPVRHPAIVEHERKRQIELKVAELMDQLEDDGYVIG
jgi:serine/arginine repetitive matrix protein 2